MLNTHNLWIAWLALLCMEGKEYCFIYVQVHVCTLKGSLL